MEDSWWLPEHPTVDSDPRTAWLEGDLCIFGKSCNDGVEVTHSDFIELVPDGGIIMRTDLQKMLVDSIPLR